MASFRSADGSRVRHADFPGLAGLTTRGGVPLVNRGHMACTTDDVTQAWPDMVKWAIIEAGRHVALIA